MSPKQSFRTHFYEKKDPSSGGWNYQEVMQKLDSKSGWRKVDNMKFTKQGNIYRITRMTGNSDSFLGISFAENIEHNPEVI